MAELQHYRMEIRNCRIFLQFETSCNLAILQSSHLVIDLVTGSID
jgi:hypothetical protein